MSYGRTRRKNVDEDPLGSMLKDQLRAMNEKLDRIGDYQESIAQSFKSVVRIVQELQEEENQNRKIQEENRARYDEKMKAENKAIDEEFRVNQEEPNGS